ncbi:MAG: cyclic nucleotide-binding domain-containing protein, partial [Proteobacteria bacterium]|nr:cyclic nucleotide-binding domain-containing protein [Pseudomonadota bacterium]MBU1542508.1 cyclic nucleotide-binding domain-containing protein [Pseudomonadota bacterium]
MVEKDLLKTIVFLQDLPEPMLEKISLNTQIQMFKSQTVLFEKNQALKQLYMLASGVVHLTIRTASGENLILDKVTPGRTFGIAALMKESSTSFSAMCAEDSSIITFSSEKIHQLFVEDFKMGHKLMSHIVKLFKDRMERHTSQFLHYLAM